MTNSDDSSDEEENDDSDDSIVRSLEMTKRLLEIAMLVAWLLRML